MTKGRDISEARTAEGQGQPEIKKQKESEAGILRNAMLDNERRKQQNRRPILLPESSFPARLKSPFEIAKVNDPVPAEARLKL
jgi:hypothetical protein